MQPKKIIFIVTGALFVILLFYLFLQGNKKKVTIKTNSGSVSINNPAELPSKKILPDGSIEFKENPNYSINYYPSDSSVAIIIYNPDIQTSRDMAEKDLLETLDLSQEDACKLTTSMAVPFGINEKAAGTNYHLSFCPNGKAFPK